jgi:hypothetical protein
MTRLNVSIFARTARRTLRAAALGLRSCREAFEVSSFAYLLRQAVAGMPLPERQPALAA